ncbi:tub family protein-like protein [Leptomonas pyrrhocoris]|uniref:Tub family protein-like protein n=1 Tax=Leptomonas pyrrhocoris TaxID=157538 RepID=A0A0N0DTC9_LEPPY|nr:tub family protein-like protein [Leptomonas pyrrhocoris]XP_015655758.1 tub family protein-like protein [Leptomonas pyrrhocoris]KPA77318.1 tub family protein-like protein [Leptomonas pyrrhocoris]KPA77319.1 tub family protein-like protein [Leptomonas pyrrhocoris]|eukprot:XP_015655757.1 tub family protein-like protein [Leptomonas pyrrhocoris]
MDPSPPPPHLSSPPRGGASVRFQRSHVVESSGSPGGTAPASPPTVPPRHPASPPPKQKGDVTVSDSSSTSENNPNAIFPAGLTEDAVQRAFGKERDAAAAVASPAGANKAMSGGESPPGNGGVGRPSGGRRSGGIVMPTRKDDSDAVSMYSLSQSVLPPDPRERVYYRPRRHLLQCYVQRKKQPGLGIASLLPGSHKSYQFFLEHTNDFVLAAVPRNAKSRAMVEDTSDGVGGHFYSISKGGGNVVFSINQQQLDGDSRSFVGKLSRRGNGLEMVMFSEGNKATRKEIVTVLLEHFEDTSQSAFTVLLPAIDAESGYMKPVEGGEVKFLRDGRGGASGAGGSRAGIDAAIADSSDEDVEGTASSTEKAAPRFAAVDGSGMPGAPDPRSAEAMGSQKKWHSHSVLAKEYKRDPRSPHIMVLKSKVPQWDGVLRGYKLDFHGRATKASEKNFQLVAVTDPEKVVMLFGKQSDDRFALDFRYPLCGLQAAAIATTIMTARKVIK